MRLLPWRRVLAVGVGVSAAGLAPGLEGTARGLVLVGFVAVMAHSLRHNRDLAHGPWRRILLGGVFALVHVVVRLVHGLLVDDTHPTPSPADLFGFAAYGFLIAGAVSLIRERTREQRREDSTDAMVVAAAVGMITLNLLLAPLLHNSAAPLGDRLLVLVYSACIIVLTGVVARISFGPGERNAAYYLLGLSAMAIAVNDVLLRGFIGGWDWALGVSAGVVPLAFTFGAAAVCHPGIADLTARPRLDDRPVGRGRLVLLASALLIGPAMLVAAEFGLDRIDRISTICGTAVLALLVLLRMADLVRAREGTSERERRLRNATTRLATGTDRAGALRAALDGALQLSLDPLTSRAVVYVVRGDELRLVLAQGLRSRSASDAIATGALAERGVELSTPVATIFEGVAALDHVAHPQEQARHVLVVPMGVGAENESFVTVVTQDRVFTQEQVASYESFASQVSLALESVQLREQMHQRRSNRRFRALVENSSDVVLVVDTDGLVSFVSPTVRRLLGREEAGVQGVPVLELVHRPDQVDVRRTLAAPSRAGGAHSSVEVRLLHGSGELRWFEVEARDLTGEDEVRGVVLTASDISDRKRAEAQLLRSEARFRLMVQNSSDVVVIIDEDNLMTYVSPSVEAMLGYPAQDMVGRNVFELLSIPEAERLRGQTMLELSDQSTEVHVQAADGLVRTLEVGITDMRHQPEVDGIVLNIRDVTARRSLEDDLRHAALHDDLTGLPNRALLTDRVSEALQATRRTNQQVGVLFVNVDDFKLINDSLGLSVGDSVLGQVAHRLEANLRVSDIAARLSGDEFAVLVGGVIDIDALAQVADQLRAALGEPLHIDGHDFHLTASVGVAIGAGGEVTGEDLLRQADAAMHAAKRAGKDRQVVFEASMQISASEELETKNALIRAVDQDEFVLHYQPIVDLATGQIRGVEALIRWEDPERGMVSPATFIPIAEETGLIKPIGYWVVAQAAQDLAMWRAMGFDIYCSVNVSGRQLEDDDFADLFVEKIHNSGVDPRAIVVELTESVLAAPGVSDIFDRFQDEGLRLALDDFGTGYSAFQYLQSFTIDIIKIDRSFVQAMNTEDDAGVVEAVVDVAHRIEATALAEGIEINDELRQLKALGVQLGQGYYFSKPIPADKLVQLLRDEQAADLPVGLFTD